MTADWRTKTVLCFSIFLSLSIASCASLKREQIQKEREDGAGQARIEFEAGRFQRAIDIYEEFRQKYPQDITVRNGYIQMVEALKSGGDRAFERKDFETAGNIYEILGNNWAHFTDIAPSLSFERSAVEKKAKASRCLFIEGQVPFYLKAGELQKALDLCREFYRKYPRDSGIHSSYIQTLEAIKSHGDRAFERKDFETAGSLYEILLRHLSSMNGSNGICPIKKEKLTEKIKACTKTLFEEGLRQYRAGNLEQAVSVWKTILSFDSGNEEVKRAVTIATLQLKNLEKSN